ncbi:MAG: hypothetical protein LBQ40_05290 [Clostridiales bacterium]|jgi:hypothetical protein|nr:hypothetical protein [Clostridiales bacterium]
MNRKRARAEQVNAAAQNPQMMHIPPQLSDAGQDAEIYNMVKGASQPNIANDKKTYYTPFSRLLLKIVCLLLIPIVLIYAITAYADKKYYPTHGDFSISVYHLDKPDKIYYVKSRDTKRFQIEDITAKADENKSWRGYGLSELIDPSTSKFGEGFDYFIVVGEDENGIAKEVEYDYPRTEHIMVAVFRVGKNGKLNDVYGNVIPENALSKSFIIFDPDNTNTERWVYNVKEIRFGLR